MKFFLIPLLFAIALCAQMKPETLPEKLPTDQRIAAYEKLIAKSPSDLMAQSGLAEAYLQKLRETADFEYLKRASGIVDGILKQRPDNYDGLRLSVEIAMNRHDFSKAAGIARQLIARNPSDSGALGMLGDSLMELGRYDEAGTVYRRMLELGGNLTSYNRVAWHEFVTGNKEDALGWMNLAVQAGSAIPENAAWCLVEFGDMLFKTGYTEQAHAAYEQALESMPGYHRAHAALGRLYAATGKYEIAVEQYRQAAAVIPLPDYAAALEGLYRKLGRPAEAEKERALLDVIDKLAIANGEKGNRMLALIYADQQRNLQRAMALMNGELDLRKDVYTYDALSWVLLATGRQKEAEQASAQAIAHNTPEPMFLYHAGVIALSGGHTEEGRDLLQRALALNSHFAFPQAEDARQRLQAITMTAGNFEQVQRAGMRAARQKELATPSGGALDTAPVLRVFPEVLH